MTKQKWRATKPDGKCFHTDFSISHEESRCSTCMAPVVDEHGETVALVVDADDFLTLAEFNGRMRLIAAAPELLDALEAMITEFGRRGGDDDSLFPADMQPPLIAQAMQVVAKAKP